VAEETDTIHHEAVTHKEYKFERQICKTVVDPKPTDPVDQKDPKTLKGPNNSDRETLAATGASTTAFLALVGAALIGSGVWLYRRFN
jgi:LPXTG-motif cell wall-anchored protein